MKIYNNFMGTLRHETDRTPETDEELKYLVKMFPDCTLHRKSNGKAIMLHDVKIKNIHWYE